MNDKSVLHLLKATKRIALWSAALTGLALSGLAQTTGAPEQSAAVAAQAGQTAVLPVPATAAAKGGFKIEETLLGQWNTPFQLVNCVGYFCQRKYEDVVSGNGRHVAWFGPCKIEGKSQLCFILDGQPLAAPTIAGISMFGLTAPNPHNIDGLSFSPDGNRVAYRAKKDDKRWVLVVDGQAGAEYDEVRDPLFSPDGKRLAYSAKKGEKWLVVVDGQDGPEHDEISEPRFSPDGKRLAYSAKKGEKWLVVVDGQDGSEYDGFWGFQFSPDGKRIAYAARRDKLWSVVVDGQQSAEYEDILGPVFSPDNKRIAYGIKKDNKWSVVVDGQVGEEYDHISYPHPIFSPDGKRVAYSAEKDKKCVVVIDGKVYAENAGSSMLLINQSVGSPRSAAESVPHFTLFPHEMWLPVVSFSPDSKRVAYTAHKGKGNKAFSVVVDGQEGPGNSDLFLSIFPVFSPDSKHVAYVTGAVGLMKTLLSMVEDGQVGGEYSDLFGYSPQFNPDSSLEFLAIKGIGRFKDGSLYRVKYIPTP